MCKVVIGHVGLNWMTDPAWAWAPKLGRIGSDGSSPALLLSFYNIPASSPYSWHSTPRYDNTPSSLPSSPSYLLFFPRIAMVGA